MKVAVVGATGMVGCEMRKVLAERQFPVSELIPVASERSVGKRIEFDGKTYTLVGIDQAVSLRPDIALFSAGGDVSRVWATRFADVGTTVIDNSSAWRMEEGIPLVVPEINGHLVQSGSRIIANPNCSTIQMVLALKAIHERYRIRRLVISTYQSITGTGAAAVTQMENERAGRQGAMAYPYTIDRNCLPHCDVFQDNGYTKEEMKLVNETRKILGDPSIRITATAVRVPVVGGHSESVNVELNAPFELADIRRALRETPGVVVQDQPEVNQYPMPRFAQGKDEVFVGRVRRDDSAENALNMWIVSDNLRKGAATNAVQIAEIVARGKSVSATD